VERMSVARAKIQTVEDIYRLVWAVANALFAPPTMGVIGGSARTG
jgi:hypothetical protein